MQFQQNLKGFRDAGLGVIDLTYDSPELQEKFVDWFGIGFSMLPDVDAETIKALGILNEEYAPGHPSYGTPYPGVFVIDPNLVIRGKVFLEG